jgi:hypothetical protein
MAGGNQQHHQFNASFGCILVCPETKEIRYTEIFSMFFDQVFGHSYVCADVPFDRQDRK